jgi:transcriptional regulator with XRE-family HTH domain
MRTAKKRTKTMTVSMIIWSNIVRQQYLQGMTDKDLCEILGITSRTLYNYRQDPSALTMKQLQRVLEKMGIEMDTLLIT